MLKDRWKGTITNRKEKCERKETAMQTGKTKKKVKRLIAFLLCVIMVLGVGTQEIIGRDVFVVNAEEGGSNESAPEEEIPAEEESSSEPEPQAEESSETPEVPETPETPEVPETPETPEVPETPETPETPEVPETPETPEVPEVPETPGVPKTPEVPETPTTGEDVTDPVESEEILSDESTKEDGETEEVLDETNEMGETGEEEAEEVLYPAFDASVEVEDGSAVVYAYADEGVFPEGTVFTARRIEADTEEYDSVEESLEQEAEKNDTEVLDFIAYDITFFDAEENEIEPNGEVQVSIEFNDMELAGAAEEDSTVYVMHINEDAGAETIQSDIDISEEQLNKVDFVAEQFSIYVITSTGSGRITDYSIEEFNGTIGEEATDYVYIEFWDKEDAEEVKFNKFNNRRYNDEDRYVQIIVYIEGTQRVSQTYVLDESDVSYAELNVQAAVKPADGYYLAQLCEWTMTNDTTESFAGNGTLHIYNPKENKKVNTLEIWLTGDANNSCSPEVTGTRNIKVDLYNYDTEMYNNAVGIDSGSLLIRSSWGNYKADGYNITDNGDNAHNESCGDTGIYYGLVASTLVDGNIQFTKKAKFFDNNFDESVGVKYSDVDFEFKYNSSTGEYSYNSGTNHVHFDEGTNTITQHQGAGPGTLSDSGSLKMNGFFPFTDENDNMTDYGFGMRMNVTFQLPEGKKLNGNDIAFSFSGDDDVWVFIDGELALDLGGLHSRRGGTINFTDGTVTYDKVDGNDVTAKGGGSQPNTEFLSALTAGEHTLTMYYLERGGNESNCEIRFNLPVIVREGTLEFAKVTGSGAALSGAVFRLYDTDQIDADTTPIATATSGTDGKVRFDISSLDETKTYYLKEISAPTISDDEGKYLLDDTVYTVKLEEKTENEGASVVTTVSGTIKDSEENVVTQIKNYLLEPVNFYLNLQSEILDTSGSIAGQATSAFTTSVSGHQSAKSSDQGIGQPINADLFVKVPDTHSHSTATVGVIGSDTASNAVAANEEIRKLEFGTNGTESGHTGEFYQILKGDGTPYFPKDGEIFDYIKEHYSLDSDNAATSVNKAKPLKINDIEIDISKLDEEHFSIRWYVFKDQNTDCWHIDGILVPKTGVLNITKTFANEDIADAAQSNGFAITVEGDFFDEAQTTETFSLAAANETVVDSSSGAVIYTWSIPVWKDWYKINEINYNNIPEWTYTGTEWNYYYADAATANGETYTGQTTGQNPTGINIYTYAMATDVEGNETAQVQTLNITNNYRSANEDGAYITVSKTFKGLSGADIQKLQDSFSVTLQNSTSLPNGTTLTLTDSNVVVSPTLSNGTVQDYTYTWTLEGYGEGTYIVSESSESYEKYQVTTTGTGNITINAGLNAWTFTPSITDLSNIVQGSPYEDIAIENLDIIIAKLQSGDADRYLIWTSESLSAGQQAAVIAAMRQETGDLNGFTTATQSNCSFYSTRDVLEKGITIAGSTVKYLSESYGGYKKPGGGGHGGGATEPGPAAAGLIFIGSSWEKVLTGTYTMSNANGVGTDISVVNTYTASLDLKKVSSGNGEPISNAVFKLEQQQSDDEWSAVEENITVLNGTTKEDIELSSLAPGYRYRLTEVQAPSEYAVLSTPIYFKVADGSIQLCTAEGEVFEPDGDSMWNWDSDETDKFVLIIKNTPAYNLPSTGGPGIYLYTLGGTLLMMTGTLLVYKKRKEEVLRS